MSLTNLDRRRANPPATTDPVYVAERASTSKAAVARQDTQSARPVFLQTGLVAQASGSAYFESDGIKVACAVYGPKQAKSKVYSNDAELTVDVRFASFATRRRKRSGKVRAGFEGGALSARAYSSSRTPSQLPWAMQFAALCCRHFG